MGVKGFTNLLREFAPDAVKPRTIGHYRGKTLAIDVSCFLNRFIYGPDPHPARVQQGMYRLAIQLAQYDIKPVFVFDGRDRIAEKKRETEKRMVAKLKIRRSFQLERLRKARLREIKGSAQLLRRYSPDQVSSILEGTRLDGPLSRVLDEATRQVEAEEAEEEGQEKEEKRGGGALLGDHEAREPAIITDLVPPMPQQQDAAVIKKSAASKGEKSDNKTPNNGDEEMYKMLSDDKQIKKDGPSEDEQAVVGMWGKLVNTFKENLFRGAQPRDADARVCKTAEHDLDTERMKRRLHGDEADGGTDEKVSDIGMAMGTPEAPTLEEEGELMPKQEETVEEEEEVLAQPDEAVREKVQTALANFVRAVDNNHRRHLEEMETLTSRKQKALHQLELDLVQQIKLLSGQEAVQQQQQQQQQPLEDKTLELPDYTDVPPAEEQGLDLVRTSETWSQPAKEQSLAFSRDQDYFVEDDPPMDDESAVVGGSGVLVSPRLKVEPTSEMHLQVEEALGSRPMEDASERRASNRIGSSGSTSSSGAMVGQTMHQVLSTHETMYWSLERRSIQITRNLVVSCQQLLEAMGQPWISADDAEAEAVCAQLTRRGFADGTVSEDSDTAVFGDGVWIRHFGSKVKGIVEVDPVVARQQLDISRDAFRDLCILCGTDFSETIEGIGPKRAVKLIKYYGSIESILANAGYKPREFFLYDHARRVFDRAPAVPEDKAVYDRRPADPARLQPLLAKYEIDPDEVLKEVLEEIQAEQAKVQLTRSAEQAAAAGGSGGFGSLDGRADALARPLYDSDSSLGMKPWPQQSPGIPSS